MKKRKKKAPPISKPSYRWHFWDASRKEKITKQKFLAYVTSFGTIEIIPLKKDEPIFVLKNHHKPSNIFGHSLHLPTDAKVIIHNGNFIWSDGKTCGAEFSINRKRIITKSLPTGQIADTGYIKNHKKDAYAPKDFSIKSIWDKESPLYGTQYIKPIKDLFKKYGVLTEMRRGHWDRLHIIEERREFVRAQRRAIAAGKIKDKSVQGICDRWESYVQHKNFKDEKEADKYTCNYIDIWRDIQALKKVT